MNSEESDKVCLAYEEALAKEDYDKARELNALLYEEFFDLYKRLLVFERDAELEENAELLKKFRMAKQGCSGNLDRLMEDLFEIIKSQENNWR